LSLVQYDDVIQAVAPDAADHSFHVGILPGASRCCDYLFDLHALDALLKSASVNAIAIPD
jgi:hypothetical protein